MPPNTPPTSKPRVSRLGRGLSSLIGTPVAIPLPPGNPAPAPGSNSGSSYGSPRSEPTSAQGAGTQSENDATPDRTNSFSPGPMARGAAESTANAPASASTADHLKSDIRNQTSEITRPPVQAPTTDGLVFLSPSDITPNPRQPRQHFDPVALQQLADSIKADGLMQPILVRPLPPALAAGNHWGADGGNAPSPRHELIAGERRWRACQIAGIPLIPALVRDVTDLQAAELALIENLQRQDLSAIERAHAFARLANEFALSHEQIAQRVGSDRSTISNTLRLLLLPEAVQQLVLEGKLSAGQARALASIDDPQRQHDLALTAINQAWSVRQLEAAAKKLSLTPGSQNLDTSPAGDALARQGSGELTTPSRRTAQLADLEAQLTAQLNTPVHVRPGKRKGSGTLAIEFYSVDQFDALLARLQVTTEG